MDAGVKLLCSCAAALAVSGAVVARMPVEQQRALLAGIGVWLGQEASPGARPSPLRVGPAPAAEPAAQASSLDSVVIPKNPWGQYETTVEIEGQHLSVLVDTGATFVCLTSQDADRLGIRPMPADFNIWVGTANGRAAVAKVNLREIRLGPVVVRNVDAWVGARGALNTSLLGMSFLGRLRGVRVEDGRLALQQ